MTGLQRDLQAKILGSNPHVYVFEHGDGLRMSGWRPTRDRTEPIEGVVAAAPFIMTHVAVSPGGGYAQPGTLLRIALEPRTAPLTSTEAQIRRGEAGLNPTRSGLPGVLVGGRRAEKLNVFPGDELLVVSFENIQYGPLGDLVPKILKFEVTGTFSTGMYEYD